LAIIAKIPSNSIPARVFDFFCRFAVIKSGVRCFEMKKFSSYFWISIELRERASNREGNYSSEAQEKAVKTAKQTEFYIFFIWQAIVRGQLFLQWTFFL
jgi:hypothetical protein